MADGSVAPKERVNIVYKSSTGDQTEDVELPLKLMMLGDYTGKESEVPVEDRDPVNINKDNFNDVMSGMNLSMDLNIHDTLSDQDDDEMSVHLDIKSINDLGPDSIAKQVPELNDMLEMRKALLALKGPLGNVPAFRKTIQKILNDDETRSVIMQELGIDDNQES
ncbi:MAG: type VI secretion system contractile sheath small subunit [Gammaproteobacteria bacterium]|jgi:type VI secretion system protein ImpB|nr:type VI secretion system contractile sheath small subunit [Gammaproteobacteria bacterium]MBT3725822.1 type VI secretion system contractile sheath small subunit [Gammaproteobacteria bacterium]MBT4075898.1 type VI secretion system contractile sheath small subunit [Gammaproteobacteria bacterium]MBT4195055.1 type VI secretion system contractile sheath small subunit [Gammaproteobacteria bacterium]MBT4860440.1 type VI secretion system contractile sheath small subunit [Gammaproteobacteria bacterium